MRSINAWSNVQVKNEELADFGRAGVVGDCKGHKDEESPVKLDGDEEETVFKNADLRVI